MGVLNINKIVIVFKDKFHYLKCNETTILWVAYLKTFEKSRIFTVNELIHYWYNHGFSTNFKDYFRLLWEMIVN